MTNPDDARTDEEPTVETSRSNLVGWGLFLLILAGVLLARIFGGGGC